MSFTPNISREYKVGKSTVATGSHFNRWSEISYEQKRGVSNCIHLYISDVDEISKPSSARFLKSQLLNKLVFDRKCHSMFCIT